MAFYMVKTKDGYFANGDLFSFVSRKSTMTLLSDVTKGKQEAHVLFDQTLFPVEKKQAKRIMTALALQECDIDIQLLQLRESGANDEIVDTILPNDVYHYGGKDLIRFTSLMLHDKYNKRDRMAIIRVGCSLYVVLDHARKYISGTALVVTEA